MDQNGKLSPFNGVFLSLPLAWGAFALVALGSSVGRSSAPYLLVPMVLMQLLLTAVLVFAHRGKKLKDWQRMLITLSTCVMVVPTVLWLTYMPWLQLVGRAGGWLLVLYPMLLLVGALFLNWHLMRGPHWDCRLLYLLGSFALLGGLSILRGTPLSPFYPVQGASPSAGVYWGAGVLLFSLLSGAHLVKKTPEKTSRFA